METVNQLQRFKSLLNNEQTVGKFKEILKEKAPGFLANLAVMVNNNEQLKKCDAMTIISAAVISASLDLPLDPNLGFAYVIPYGDKGQFQIGYKGFIQLAMRSGQYKTMNVTEIYEGEMAKENRMTGEYEFDQTKRKSDKIVGYAAYFRLINGFEKTVYWSIEQVEKHGKRYSQTYKRGGGKWVDDFESMARKTVIKNLISKWGIMSIEMQMADKYDQGVIKDISGEVEYVDNELNEKQPVPNPLKPKLGRPPKTEFVKEPASAVAEPGSVKEGELLL